MTTEPTTGTEEHEAAADLSDEELAADLRRRYDELSERAEELEDEAGRIGGAAEHLSEAADLLEGEVATYLDGQYAMLHERADEIGAEAEGVREAAEHLSDAADLLEEGVPAQGEGGGGEREATP